jgi:serine/threonine-protein phosphatase 2A regulatory subunit A
MSPAQIEEFYVPLLKRLSSGEWFTSRTSSAALYPAAYPHVSPAIQDELRKGFTALSSDDTPMVRRAAAKWLGVRCHLSFPCSNFSY